eukprot:NODE_3770_length_733_cov_48.001462_g3173_i0.p1 GENE.NODE_3770_length_733_cov_48.001462_g3173_i0~~NODE_3770_length_733_cov_48.001462_g3173_i0.p1  ORF type:complete len:165 (+),score=17.52 NODE_3770_length_733_cov_48.001462_g3173_i0:28-522(+)
MGTYISRTPLLLSCGHSLCWICARGLSAAAHTFIHCPICRAKVPFEAGSNHPPINHALDALLWDWCLRMGQDLFEHRAAALHRRHNPEPEPVPPPPPQAHSVDIHSTSTSPTAVAPTRAPARSGFSLFSRVGFLLQIYVSYLFGFLILGVCIGFLLYMFFPIKL